MNHHSSTATKPKEIKRAWHLVDVKEQILGRIGTKIASMLMGRSKPYFVRHLDCGDYVVVVNSNHVMVTGNKDTNKIYTQYSGYPGGIKKATFAQLKKSKSEEIIRHAVYGMLPDNKLRAQIMKRLFIYTEDKHPYEDKFKTASG